MLLQQETIASLMGLLETARAEAAASLAPLTRPPSPTKRAALLSEAEAQGRVRQERCKGRKARCSSRRVDAIAVLLQGPCPLDRTHLFSYGFRALPTRPSLPQMPCVHHNHTCPAVAAGLLPPAMHSIPRASPCVCREALIRELRDACLCLAEAGQDSDAQSSAAQLEARVRELHAALEAAGASRGSPSTCCSPRLAHAPDRDSPEQWAIMAVRPTAALTDTASNPASPRAMPLPAQHQSTSGPLKSALKRPPAASSSWAPARPSAHAAVPAARQLLRPGSARLADNCPIEDGQAPQQARSDTAHTPREALPQQQPHQREGSPPAQQATSGRWWRADDGLAEYEASAPAHEEQARSEAPRPFRLGSAAQRQGLPPAASCQESGPGAGRRVLQTQARELQPATRQCSQAPAAQQVQGAQHQEPPQLPSGLHPPPSSSPASAFQAGSPMRRPSSARPQAGSPSQVGMVCLPGASSSSCRVERCPAAV